MKDSTLKIKFGEILGMQIIKKYEPNRDIKNGVIETYRIMFLELMTASELGVRLFKRDFFAKYRQALLGFLWCLIFPLFSASVFVLMNKSGLLKVENISVPYVFFVLYGITVWSLFTNLTIGISQAVSLSDKLIVKINFPRIALMFSPVLIALVDFVIRILLFIVVVMYYKTSLPLFYVPFSLLALIPLILFAVGIGLFFTVAGAVFKDLPNMLAMLFNILMFASPVLYPITNENNLINTVSRYNPITYLFDFPRNLLLYGSAAGYENYIWFSVFAIIVFLAGWRFYHVSISRVIEKV